MCGDTVKHVAPKRMFCHRCLCTHAVNKTVWWIWLVVTHTPCSLHQVVQCILGEIILRYEKYEFKVVIFSFLGGKGGGAAFLEQLILK